MVQFNPPNTRLTDYLMVLGLIFNIDFKKKVEERLKELFQYKFALFTASGKQALYLLYKSLDSKNKKVIISPLTCYHAILPFIFSGYEPVFVDIEPGTLNLNYNDLENKIKSSGGNILQLVYLSGNPENMREIQTLKEKYGLTIIEDICMAFGSYYNGKLLGTFGEFAATSFMKNIYSTGGGALFLDDEKLFNKIKNESETFERKVEYKNRIYRFLRSVFNKYAHLKVCEVLYNKLLDYRDISLDNLPIYEYDNFCDKIKYYPNQIDAAITYSQLSNYDDTISRKRKIALSIINKYPDKFIFQQEEKNSFWNYTNLLAILKDGNSYDTITKYQKRKIDVKHLEDRHNDIVPPRLDKIDLFANNDSLKSCNNYLSLYDKIINIPLSKGILSAKL